MKMTVEAFLVHLDQGGDATGVEVTNLTDAKVTVKQALTLQRAGVYPEEAQIVYDDNEIVYDEDIDGLTITSGPLKLSWEEKAARAKTHTQTAVTLDLQTNDEVLNAWIIQNQDRLRTILQPVVVSLFEAELAVKAG